MNKNYLQVDYQLIKSLLHYPSSKELAILAANIGLLNAGILQGWESA